MARIVSGLLLVSLLSNASAIAAREWTDASGRNKITADFVEMEGETVRLKKADGKLTALPLHRLSREDQQFAMAEQRRRVGQPHQLSAAGQKILKEIVESVRKEATAKGKLSDEEFDAAARGPLTQEIITQSAKLVKQEGTRRALASVVAALAEDPDPLVRLAVLKAALDLGDNVVAAAPQVMTCLDDSRPGVASQAEFLLHHWTQHASAVLPACVAAQEGTSMKRSKFAYDLMNQLQNATQTEFDESAVRLCRVVLDKKRPLKLRYLAASGAAELFTRAAYSHGQDFDGPPALEGFAPPVAKARHEKLLRELLALLDDSPTLLCTGVLRVVASAQPKLLSEIPPATVARLLEISLQEPERQDDDFERWGYVTPLQWASGRQEVSLNLSAEDVLRMLRSDNDRLRDYVRANAANIAVTLVGKPDFIKLLAHTDAEIRRSAVLVLAVPGDTSLAALPQLSVRVTADAAGKIQKLTVGDETVKQVAGLAEVVKRRVPALKQGGDTDPEALLKKAADDTDPQVRHAAVEALAQRRTAGSMAILRLLASESLREDTRQLAPNMSQNSRHHQFDRTDDVESLDGDDQESSEPSRPFAVELAVDPKLNLTELVALLGQLHRVEMSGARWIAFDTKATGQAELQLEPVKGRPWEQHAPFLSLEIGAGEQNIFVKVPQGVRLRAPSLAAVRFFTCATLDRNWPNRHREQPLDQMDRYDRRRLSPRDTAYQEMILLSATPEARCELGRRVLETVAYDPEEQLGVADLVQWVAWTKDGKPQTGWFVRAVAGK